MRTTTSIIATVSVLVLSACSSGGGSEPPPLAAYPEVHPPVLSPPGAIPLDAAFNMPVAQVTGTGAGDVADIRIHGVEFDDFDGTSPRAVTLILPDGTSVGLTRPFPALGPFTGLAGGRGYTLEFEEAGTNWIRLSLRSGPAGGAIDQGGLGLIGWQTAPAAVPAGGSVRFRGGSYLYTQFDGFTPSMPPTTQNGFFDLTIDLTNDTVTGIVHSNGIEEIGITAGRVTGNTFNGRLTANAAGFDTIDGRVDGLFFGAAMDEIGGTFEGRFTGPADGTLSGVFAGPPF